MLQLHKLSTTFHNRTKTAFLPGEAVKGMYDEVGVGTITEKNKQTKKKK